MCSSDWSDVFAASLKEFTEWGFSDSDSNLPASAGSSLYDDAATDLYSPVENIPLRIKTEFNAAKSNSAFNFDIGGESQVKTISSGNSASEEIASLLSCDYGKDFMTSNYFFNGDFLDQDKVDRDVSNPCSAHFFNFSNGNYPSSTVVAESSSHKGTVNQSENYYVEDIKSNQIPQYAFNDTGTPMNFDFHQENISLTNRFLNIENQIEHSVPHESLYKEHPLLSTPNKFRHYNKDDSLLAEQPCFSFQAAQFGDSYQNLASTLSSPEASFLHGCLCMEANHEESCMHYRAYSSGPARNSFSPSQFFNDFCTWSEKSIDHCDNNFHDNKPIEDHATMSTDKICNDDCTFPAVNLHGSPHERIGEKRNVDERTTNRAMLDVSNDESQFTRYNKVMMAPSKTSIQEDWFERKLIQSESLSRQTSEKDLTVFPRNVDTTSLNNIEFVEINCERTSVANKPKIQTILLKRIKIKNRKKITAILPENCTATPKDQNSQSDQSLHSDTKNVLSSSSLSQTKDQAVRPDKATVVAGSSPPRQTNINKEIKWHPILPALPQNHIRTQQLPVTVLVPAINQQSISNHLLPVNLPSGPVNCSTEFNLAVSGTSAVAAVNNFTKFQQPQPNVTSSKSSNQPYTILQLHSDAFTKCWSNESTNSCIDSSSDRGAVEHASTIDRAQLQIETDSLKIPCPSSGKNKSPYFSSICNRRTRPSFSVIQLKILQRRFERSQYIPKHEIGELANILELSQLQVKMWFQNRRSKYKKLLRRAIDLNSSKRKDFPAEISAATLSEKASPDESVVELLEREDPSDPLAHHVQLSPSKANALKSQPKSQDVSKHRIFDDLEDNLTLRNRTAPAHPNSYGK